MEKHWWILAYLLAGLVVAVLGETVNRRMGRGAEDPSILGFVAVAWPAVVALVAGVGLVVGTGFLASAAAGVLAGQEKTAQEKEDGEVGA